MVGPKSVLGAERLCILAGAGAYFVLLTVGWLIARALLPDQITIAALGHEWRIGDPYQRLLRFGLFVLVMVPGVFALEAVCVGWNRCSLRQLIGDRRPTVWTDLVSYLLWHSHLLNFAQLLLTFGAALYMGRWLNAVVRDWTGVTLSLAGLPLGAQIVCYLLIYTFFDYWAHRLDHSPLFWPLHRYHHSAEEFCILTSDRVHPANFSTRLALYLPLALIATPPATLFGVSVFVVALRYVIHSRMETKFGWVGRWILQSPVHHRVHHSLSMSRGTANFSLMPLWDRLFGTWRADGSQAIPIGVDEPYRHGPWVFRDMLRDYKDFLVGAAQLCRIGRWSLGDGVPAPALPAMATTPAAASTSPATGPASAGAS